jgi:glucose-6-phosphate isomerase
MAAVSDDFDDVRRAVARELAESRAVERLFAGDHTLFQDDPTECANRLGWVDEPVRAVAAAADLTAEVRAATADADEVVWCGMGGSSLFPELISLAPLPRDTAPSLHVVDSSHPAPIRRVLAGVGRARRLYVFASKSGGTIETRTQLETLTAADPDAPVAVVTDAGSELEAHARSEGWRVWLANPDIGGRFSAFSTFGAAATVATGVDLAAFAAPAVAMNDVTRGGGAGSALELATFVTAAARVGRDKLTLLTPPSFAGFGPWVEQLVAESTGKHGVGVLPVVDEPPGAPEVYGDDRCFVTYGDTASVAALRDRGHPVLDLGPVAVGSHLGGELQRWMLATAWIGAALRINPFDQPDVESAKRAALAALQGAATESPEPGDPAPLLAALRPGDHIVIQAFVDPGGPLVHELDELRLRLRARHGCAVTVGIGPRYLHSSGQLHKGGPNNGVFLQVLDPGPDDVAIPGRDFGFAALLRAQADGDHAALVAAGRRVMRVAPEAILASA